ncbi:MAG: uracil-DNA glycosylase [Pseudomonadota bacterium]
MDAHALKAALEWQIELGADEAICDAPINRFELAKQAPKSKAPPPHLAPVAPVSADPIGDARAAAGAAGTLDALREALGAYPHCELRKGARSLVFSDGQPEARLMLVGEAPGRDEDIQGKPFVGRAGQLLDLMFAEIGISRHPPAPEQAFYITNVLPWRPPQNRDPTPEEIAMILPFVERHIELAQPDILVLIGNHACQALLGRRGITKLRGQWNEVKGRPALPMLHPAYLLRNAAAKREAWADMLALQARMREG